MLSFNVKMSTKVLPNWEGRWLPEGYTERVEVAQAAQRPSRFGRTVVLCTTILCSVKAASHNVLTVYLTVDVRPDL